MKRRPPRSTLDRSPAASDVYKRQGHIRVPILLLHGERDTTISPSDAYRLHTQAPTHSTLIAVSYTHLRAHETVLDIVCRLLLAKKKQDRKIKHKKNTTHILMLISTHTMIIQANHKVLQLCRRSCTTGHENNNQSPIT